MTTNVCTIVWWLLRWLSGHGGVALSLTASVWTHYGTACEGSEDNGEEDAYGQHDGRRTQQPNEIYMYAQSEQ